MQQSFSNAVKANSPENRAETFSGSGDQWCFEIPPYKLLRWYHYLAWAVLFLIALLIFSLADFDFFFQDYWALLILPVTGLFFFYLILNILPNKQIFYVIDEEGVFAEVHLTYSEPVALFRLLFGFLRTSLSDNSGYSGRHYTEFKSIRWDDVRNVEVREALNLIVLKGALKGNVNIWTTSLNFSDVYASIMKFSGFQMKKGKVLIR